MPGLDKVLKAVANKRRLALLRILRTSREATVDTLAKGIRLSLRSTSKHLRVLAAAEIVESEQRGLFVHYRVAIPTHPILRTINSTS